MRGLFVFLIIVNVAFLTSCKKSDSKENEIDGVEKDNSYVGLLKVSVDTPAEYEQSDVEVSTEIIGDTLLIMSLLKVKFSAQMPVTIDMTIKGIEITKNAEGYTLSGNEIIPLGGIGEYPQYIITDLTGKLTSKTLEFSMKSGGNPVTYSGIELKTGN